ncbi:hypothetical protein OAJ27_01700 [bacterium]|nr:hypothetical protein [bacterium]
MICLCINIFSVFNYAGLVNVINNKLNNNIFLNGKNYGSQSMINIQLSPGTHVVQLKNNEQVLGTKTFVVKPAVVETVDLNVLFSSEMANADSQSASAQSKNAELVNSGGINIINSINPSGVVSAQAGQALTNVNSDKMGKINIINRIKNSQIYINGKALNMFNAHEYPLRAGTHIVEVKAGDKFVYKKTVSINENEIVSISPDYVANDVREKEELKRLKKARGTWGLGFQLQSVSGFSLKKYFGRFGVNLVGFVGEDGSDELNNPNDSDTDYGVNIGLRYNLVEKLGLRKLPFRVYTGVNYGIDTFEPITLWTNAKDSYATVVSALMGIEFDTRIGSYSFGIEYRVKDYVYTTESYSWSTNSYTPKEIQDSKQGFLFNLGYHFYF